MSKSLLEIFVVLNTAAFVLNCMFAAALFCNDHSGEAITWSLLALLNGFAAQSAKAKLQKLPKL